MVQSSSNIKYSTWCQSGQDCEFLKQGKCKFYHPQNYKARGKESKQPPGDNSLRNCKYGQSCKYYRDGRCRFRHLGNQTSGSTTEINNSLEDIIFISSSCLEKSEQSFQLQDEVQNEHNRLTPKQTLGFKKVHFQAWPRNILIPCKEEVLESASDALWWTEDDYRFFREREEALIGEDEDETQPEHEEVYSQKDFGYNVKRIQPPQYKFYDLWGSNNSPSFSLFANGLLSPKSSPIPCFDDSKCNTPTSNGYGWGANFSFGPFRKD